MRYKRVISLGVVTVMCLGVLGGTTDAKKAPKKKEPKLHWVTVDKDIYAPISDEFVEVLEKPDSSSSFVARLFMNTGCKKVDVKGDYYKIESGEIEGYVHKEDVVNGKALEKVVNANADDRDLVVKYNEVVAGYKTLEKAKKSKEFKYEVKGKVLGDKVYKSSYAGEERNDILVRKNVAVLDDNITVKDDTAGKKVFKCKKDDVLDVIEVNSQVKVSKGDKEGYIPLDSCHIESQLTGVSNIVKGKFDGKYQILSRVDNMLCLKIDGVERWVEDDHVKMVVEPVSGADMVFGVDEPLEVTEYSYDYVKVMKDNEEYYIKSGNYKCEAQFSDAVPFEIALNHDTHGDYDMKSARYEYDYEKGTEGATDKRDEIIKFALKHLGNPYVWGGTDLKNGCDCSAFVQGVLRKFGYDIGRTTRDQCAELGGEEITDDDLTPGDLIYYTRNGFTPYHVVMYIGDDMCVNASCRRLGICISPVRWDRVYKIKNYID